MPFKKPLAMKYSYLDYINIADNMMEFGGSFVKALGKALIHADIHNSHKLAGAFPEYFEEYKNIKIKKNV